MYIQHEKATLLSFNLFKWPDCHHCLLCYLSIEQIYVPLQLIPSAFNFYRSVFEYMHVKLSVYDCAFSVWTIYLWRQNSTMCENTGFSFDENIML